MEARRHLSLKTGAGSAAVFGIQRLNLQYVQNQLRQPYGRPACRANDGMLHAFRESNGVELWGFVSPDLLDDLKAVPARTGMHDFLVDGSPIAADAKIGASPNWKTFVMFGLRRGGRHYYALDITDTTNPQYKWSMTDSRMGETWSEPAVGKIRLSDNTHRYVAFVGGGYDTASNNSSGNAFIDMDTAAEALRVL